MPSRPLYNQGLEKHVDLKQQPITAQRTLDLIKEKMKSYPSFSLLRYTQPFELKCGASDDGMSIILCTMQDYEFNIVPCHEVADTSSWKLVEFSMSNSDEKRIHSLLENSNGSFTHEALERHMIYGRHI